MEIPQLHSWNVTLAEAAELQKELAARVDVRMPLTRWDLVAGADVSHERFSNTIYGGVVVLRREDGSLVESQHAVYEATFPYVPGFLSFREAPAMLRAFAKLQVTPDVVMIDGQGIAHPRRIGIATHVGLWLNLPCLGCAKSRLFGRYQEPGWQAGSLAPLKDGDEVIGSVVRTKNGVKPVFVSAGHRIDLPSAVRVVLSTCRGYRLPEPLRQAHLYVNTVRRAAATHRLAADDLAPPGER